MKRQLGGHPVDETLTPLEDLAPAPNAVLAPQPPAPASPRRKRRSPARWFWLSLASFLLSIVAVEAVDYVQAMLLRDRVLGGIFAALLGLTVLSAVAWAAVETRRIRRLRAVEPLRAEGLALSRSEGYEGALPWIDRAAAALGDEAGRLVETARDRILDTHTDASAMRIFHDTVLAPLDQRAYAAIARAARGAALGVSVSPIALVDGALVLWRSVRMVREIAEIYGLRPGLASSLVLMRHLLVSGLTVVGVDVLGNVWFEHLGGRLTSFVSSRLAEGVVAAVRVGRLGLLTMEACRPLPFTDADRPGLAALREQILKWDA